MVKMLMLNPFYIFLIRLPALPVPSSASLQLSDRLQIGYIPRCITDLQILCFWTLSIVLLLSKDSILYPSSGKTSQLVPFYRASPYLSTEDGNRIQSPKR
jgi:hypothetical protein